MFVIAPHDVELNAATGLTLIPPNRHDVSYLLETKLGAGGMSVIYKALRRSKQGESLAVVKLLLPKFVSESQELAITSISKEASSLSLLNQQIPPTPFVVRLYDFGFVKVSFAGKYLSLPWIAIELIQGGPLGTTLAQRIDSSYQIFGHAFDMARAARAMDHICQGLTAMHEVNVIHRDIKPDNVLCCGFDESEIFKITDFGIARTQALTSTFGGLPIGTPGYAPMEQLNLKGKDVGPWTDVFALGAIAYYILTGEFLFDAHTLYGSIQQIEAPTRRSIQEGKMVDPELLSSSRRCSRIDEAIARATAAKPQERPRTVREFASLLLPHLTPESNQLTSRRTVQILQSEEGAVESRTWTIRHASGGDRVLRDVAWNGDGTALAVTSIGLGYWTGTEWQQVPLQGYPDPTGLRFVHKTAQNHWILGGTGATLATFSGHGLEDVIQGQDSRMVMERASGDPSDLAVMVASVPGSPPLLLGMAARRWLRAMPLEDVSMVTGLARVNDARWIVTGRTISNRGFIALYEPMQWQFVYLAQPTEFTYLACNGLPSQNVGVAVGTDATIAIYKNDQLFSEKIPGEAYLSAVALSPTQQIWASSGGKIYWRRAGEPSSWSCVWQNKDWQSPLISLQADAGLLRAMSVDGGVIESWLRENIPVHF